MATKRKVTENHGERAFTLKRLTSTSAVVISRANRPVIATDAAAYATDERATLRISKS